MAKAPDVRRTDPAAPLVFAAFAVAGILYIIVSKSLSISPFFVTGVPVAIMITYAVAVWTFKRLRLRDDQVGDNFYYMGFIYTLVSLGMSLYQYQSTQNVDEIVRNFGVAVASTIAGIILRILFNQMRRDPQDFEAISRVDLAEATRRVRHEMDGINQEIQHFRRTNLQMLEESFHETQRHMNTLTGKSDEVSAAMDRSVQSLDQAARSLRVAAESITLASRPIAATSTELRTASRGKDGVSPTETQGA